MEEIDLYEVLGIQKGATKVEIKKAYHKAALSHHPDKVAEDERVEAEVRFKAAKQAYEILSDDQKRDLYDTHGMAAFDPSKGMGEGPDMEDILAQMFGGGMGFSGMPGMGGMGGMGGMPGGPGRMPRKGMSEQQEYQVTLEELYKGKTTKFATSKNVVCSNCKGSGGKQGAKSTACATCGGRGARTAIRQVGPMLTQETVPCGTCSGSGQVWKEKDRCKKCKGKKVVEAKKMIELYIPRGARQGDRIVIEGEADQLPDQEPGDIIFELVEAPHDVFERAGADLKAELNITLVEALTGFNRVVLTHLDGRGISLNVKQPGGKILRPGQVLKIEGEGMPVKKSDAKGDLYLTVEIDFPEDGWMNAANVKKLKEALPPPKPEEDKPEDVDELDFDSDADLDDFGAGSGDPRAGGDWEDDEDEEGGPQCATQ